MSAKYHHSAYYYAYNYGWTYSESKTFTGAYLDRHTYRPRNASNLSRILRGKKDFDLSEKEFDSTFNPLLLATLAMVDIGLALRDNAKDLAQTAKNLADPAWRAERGEDLRQQLRILRRPFYYARENERRRRLAAERRKITRRRTTAPMPTPEDILDAWNHRKESKDAMIRLGGMLHDLECYVDNRLRIDEYDNIVGRNGGIRGWLKECLPELSPKYKTLMRYKAMAIKLRQATETRDPVPTARLLAAKAPHEVVAEIRADERNTFAALLETIDFHLSPENILRNRHHKISASNSHIRGSADLQAGKHGTQRDEISADDSHLGVAEENDPHQKRKIKPKEQRKDGVKGKTRAAVKCRATSHKLP